MALPPLTPREIRRYLDSMTVYMPVYKSGTLTVIGYTIRPLSPDDPTPLENVPCNLHRTPNYNTGMADSFIAKENTLLTANKTDCQYVIPVKSGDLVHYTTRNGDTEWGAPQGEPKRPVKLPHAFFYTVPVEPPKTLI